MRIHPGLSLSAGRLSGGAVAIGNFDGVHLGHRALLDRCVLRSPAAVLTFEPHPARLLAPAYAPQLICTRSRKQELLSACGVTDLIEQPFDRAFASTEAGAFVEALIATGVAEVIVGHDFTYGANRAGTVDSLRLGLEEQGVRLQIVPPVTVSGLVVSSTKIREFTLAGRVEAAASLLGRQFDLDGVVVRGAGRGRKLGWPTANIHTENELLPAVGVYAVRAKLRMGEEWEPALGGAANLGLNPTFREGSAQAGGPGKPQLMLEIHLFDLDRDLYGATLRVAFVQRLREERRFPGPDALKAQIARDVDEARRLLAS